MKTSAIVATLGAVSTTNALLTIGNNDCASFTHNLTLAENTSILNTTYHAPHTVNITSGQQNIYNSHGFCEVDGTVSYGRNSTLHFSVYLPDALPYNGRFMAVGNGGMAGVLDKAALMQQLNSGFASAAGDAGHLASLNNDGSGAPDTYIPYLHNPEEVQAWIHDAIALFVPSSKDLIEAYYNKSAAYSYYSGCSTGGAQGFALAQYHPELFDGIIAGCPGNWYSHLALSFLWNAQHAAENTSAYLPQTALNFTGQAVLEACDAQDGVKDGVIENPLKCNFSIDSLACNATQIPRNNNTVTCLTPDQIVAAEAIYAGPKDPDTGEELYPGFAHGSEIQWILQEGSLSHDFSVPILQNLVYGNLSYNASAFNWTSDVADVDTNAGAFIDAISANLTAFRDRGGRLLVYQGWADPFNAQTWPIQHYEDVQSFFKDDISDFYNVFMIPGGGHCGAASFYPQVPATYHTVPALMDWVERGEKPEEVLTTNPTNGDTRSRKLCAWPKTAIYVQGNTDDWKSYVCE
ncbi:tannase and feruloyl esterase [Aureobasidium pullulans]|uniref:Carboxylic ester hydrolase n=1 Tax=Aureobasidium pullulans TaxID=5580 RepID=A0A4V4JS17_AURPU|nr:tannase and feruloyl esterase [Aureobasidium pullulans]